MASALVDSAQAPHFLRPDVLELKAILSGIGGAPIDRRSDISANEIRTPHGLAISPTMAAMCADDVARTITFIRGAYAAIMDIRRGSPDRRVRVLYVGCGPYALLAVPIMAMLAAAEATFTLLDVNAESIESAKSIVEGLGFADRVASFENLDAMSYRVGPAHAPDVIMMEIMRSCLESEPQVAVARHLLRQAPNALLIPEQVRVDLVMVDPSREFDFDGPPEQPSPIRRDRIPVASVFTLDGHTVSEWKDICTEILPAATVRLPDAVAPRYQPMLFTTVRVYRDHVLRDYDSGLTYPRSLSIGGAVGPGDVIRFSYRLGSDPRLVAESTERPQ